MGKNPQVEGNRIRKEGEERKEQEREIVEN
jgi:hypothetical protein